MPKNNLEKFCAIKSRSALQFKYYFIILTLFIATWHTSNIAAIKLISIFNVTLTGGFIIFPITTMLGSILVEVYGFKNARQAIWAGFIFNLSYSLAMNIVNLIPASPNWPLHDQFNNVILTETRIITASIISFFISDFSNSYLMAKMKIESKGRSLLKRIIVAYSLSASIDIIIFIFLAFVGTMPSVTLIKLMMAAYLKRYICQIILLPALWYAIDKLKKAEGYDIYDIDTNFNPFSIDNIYELNSIRDLNVQLQNIPVSAGLAYEIKK